jgi:hypothetical protein
MAARSWSGDLERPLGPALRCKILDHEGLPSTPPPLAPTRTVRLPFWEASPGEEVGAEGSGDGEEESIAERFPP